MTKCNCDCHKFKFKNIKTGKEFIVGRCGLCADSHLAEPSTEKEEEKR